MPGAGMAADDYGTTARLKRSFIRWTTDGGAVEELDWGTQTRGSLREPPEVTTSYGRYLEAGRVHTIATRKYWLSPLTKLKFG